MTRRRWKPMKPVIVVCNFWHESNNSSCRTECDWWCLKQEPHVVALMKSRWSRKSEGDDIHTDREHFQEFQTSRQRQEGDPGQLCLLCVHVLASFRVTCLLRCPAPCPRRNRKSQKIPLQFKGRDTNHQDPKKAANSQTEQIRNDSVLPILCQSCFSEHVHLFHYKIRN